MDFNRNNDPDRGNEEPESNNSSFRLYFKSGQVTGMPKDSSSAPDEIQLSHKFYQQSHEAMKSTKQSGNEWGFLIHLNETGQLLAGELEEGTPDEWIRSEEYLKRSQLDPTIHGLLHTHPVGDAVFSYNNMGFFLAAKQVIQICMAPRGEYLLLLRTEQTIPPREGIAQEVTDTYTRLVRELSTHYIIEHQLEPEAAIEKGVFQALIELCKRYNIALYQGDRQQHAKKVK